MIDPSDPTATAAWGALAAHAADDWSGVHLRDLFRDDPGRAARYTHRLDDLLFDFSKHRITDRTLGLLVDLARERKVPEAIAAMFGGQRINETENRAVLHVALRHRGEEPIEVDGQDVMPDVNAVLQRIRTSASGARRRLAGPHRQGRSPTSSTSASAAPTSARRWSARR
jgi:glucose-6-phosphate isomerase